MLKKLVLNLAVMVVALTGSINFALAQVEVNKADQAALESVKGIGPSTSMKILDARKTGGAFKGWPDFANRVKGIGDKTAVKLSDAGLTVNGQSLPNAGVVPPFAAKAKQASARDGKSTASTGAATGVPAGAVIEPSPTMLKGSTRPVPQSLPLFPSTTSTSSRPAAPAAAR